MSVAIYPRNNYHLAGSNALLYAVMLMKQLPDAYNIVTSDAYADVFKGVFPSRNVFTSKTQVDNDKHCVIVIPHVSVDQTMVFHESVRKPDYLYTIQVEDVDIMPDVQTVDTETELLKYLRFYGTGCKELIESMLDTVTEDVPVMLLAPDWKFSEHPNANRYSLVAANREDEGDVINDCCNFKYAWTYGKEPVNVEGVLNIKVRNGRCVR